MVEGAESGGPEIGPGSKPPATVETGGGRVRFRVELTPGETTMVSWKKLLKEANLSEPEGPGPSTSGPSVEGHGGIAAEPPPPPPPAAASRMKEKVENEPKESQAQGGPNRLSNVIERIERMYAGSSDEEDLVLDNMPDDDEYDTDDSFIDDAELDDYFQVDNSAIKHDGFFVNRGKLERIEPSISMDQQPKKRRRKDMVQGGGSDDGRNPHKITKIGNKGRKTSSSIRRSSISQAIPNIDSPANPTEVITKKFADIQVAVNTSGLQNGDTIGQDMNKDLQKPGVNPSNEDDKISHGSKAHSGKQDNVDGLAIQQKGKGGLDINVATSKASLPMEKESLTPRKEGSSVRPKSTNLEKAFKELEKIVAQSRPPSTEPQDQSVKKRLPAEIKLKLAKVARIAVSDDGHIPKDVINRLMSIMGHLMHITTLKRNLRAMANMGLSAKQEKDAQIQKMKQEVVEMVKLRTSRLKSKLEQHANSDDFQEASPEERESWKRKYGFDSVLENKICDLYDLNVERLEEDSGPPLRKLYEELASLWPSGFMHNDDIKHAICRAKDRRGLCSFRKDREKIKKKKVVVALAQDASNSTQPMDSHEKLLSRDRGSKLVSNPVPGDAHVAAASAKKLPNLDNPKQETTKKLISSSTINLGELKLSSLLPKVAAASAKKLPNLDNPKQETTKKLISSSTTNLGELKLSSFLPKVAAASAKKGPNLDNPKQEKTKKLISSSTLNLGEPKLSSLLPKKKVKVRKPKAEVAESKLSLEKLVVSQGRETTQN